MTVGKVRVGLNVVEHVASGRSDKIPIMDPTGEQIGFIDYLATDGWLDVRWIELAVEHRRRGLGAEAVQLLEAEAAGRWGVRGMRAHVPGDVGLALYFWLRLGYRPEAPVDCERDAMAMVRELGDDR